MVDLTTVKTDASKVVAEVGFVRANWGKLSIIIVLTFVVGAAVGHFV